MSSEKSSPFESSMTDLMISLALIFMLLLASVMLQITHKSEAEKKQSGKTRTEIINELSKELSKYNIVTKPDNKDPLSLIIVVGEDHNKLKFNRDEYLLDTNDKNFLKQIIPKIMNLLYYRYENEIDAIRIEGYTDNDGDDWHNLELSQKRALSVLNYSLCSEIKMHQLVKEFVVKKASINGRGEIKEYLIYTNNSVNKPKSRRVEIKIKIKSQEQKKLEQEMMSENKVKSKIEESQNE